MLINHGVAYQEAEYTAVQGQICRYKTWTGLTRNVNMSELQTRSITVREPHSDKSSVRELHTHNVNMSEPQTCSSKP